MEYKFDENGLLCAIAQDAETGEVLMQAFMNREAIDKTLETGFAHYYSRSRKCLWKKGETSGNVQRVIGIKYDCDADCLLLRIDQKGAACHTGERSCFHRELKKFSEKADYRIVFAVRDTIRGRKENPVEGSYTNYLFRKGTDKICKKIGEEASEVIIAAKNKDKRELTCELSDLLYHALVLMENEGVEMEDVFQELEAREGRPAEEKYKNR